MLQSLFLSSFKQAPPPAGNNIFKNREAVQIFHKYEFLLLKEDVKHYMKTEREAFEIYALEALQAIGNSGCVLMEGVVDQRPIDLELKDQAPSIS